MIIVNVEYFNCRLSPEYAESIIQNDIFKVNQICVSELHGEKVISRQDFIQVSPKNLQQMSIKTGASGEENKKSVLDAIKNRRKTEPIQRKNSNNRSRSGQEL